MTRAVNPVQEPAAVSDAEFARAFFRRAVTRERVVAALESLRSKEFGFGPYSATGLARVAATGTLGTANVVVADVDQAAYEVTVPAVLDLSIRLGVESTLRADAQIDLVLTPRAAAPLLLVIDIAAVRAQDVRITVHGTGLGGVLSGLLGSLVDELRGQVARQITAVLDTERSRRARTFDIRARIDGTRDAPAPDKWDWIDDAEFGRRFGRYAVTEQRVRRAFAGFTGQPVEIGPLGAGPGKAATVRVVGQLTEPTVVGAGGSFEITLALQLDLVVELGRASRFHADVEVPLVAVPRAGADLHIVVDIADVAPASVRVTLRSASRIAGLVGRLGGVEAQIREQVARTVNRRVATAAGRIVDIGARIDGAGARKHRPRLTPRPTSA
ncbi:MAG: hypothetical protein M3Y06_04540 [Actinomycetota bacterium]|nr:hypothetical protein [Actinomycetota bacterium]